jgi:hypothetical protein
MRKSGKHAKRENPVALGRTVAKAQQRSPSWRLFGRGCAVAITVVVVAAVVVAVLSYWRENTVSYGWSGQDEVVFCALKGELSIFWRHDPAGVDAGWHGASTGVGAYRLQEEFAKSHWGFALEDRAYPRRSGGEIRVRKALVPLPAVAGVAMVVVVLLAGLRRAARRRWRLANGICIACGYDLTGNVSGKCPECGVAVPT